MKTEINNLITEIQGNKARFGEDMSPPATAQEIEALRTESIKRLKYTVPQAYLDVLTQTNGIDLNGYQLYASAARTRPREVGGLKHLFRGLVEANEQWRDFDPNKEFVFFAESGDVLYCHNLISNKFEIVDRITNEMDNEATDAFEDCETLLIKLFNHMLNRYDEPQGSGTM